MDNQYVKETIYRIVQRHGERHHNEKDEKKRQEQEEFQKVQLSFKEGRNELGQQWQEDK